MLYIVNNPDEQIERLAGDLVGGYVFRNFVTLKHEGEIEAKVFGDDPNNPSVLLGYHKGAVMVAGDPSLYNQVWRDVYSQSITGGSIDARSQDTPEEQSAGKRWLFCHSTPREFWAASTQAGFSCDDDKQVPARLWYLVGKPQFAELVKFPCRLGVGEELVDLLIQGIEYDPEGEYIRKCVKLGPSFVCEIEGEPVCWSATHMTGTLAMVYTPEHHRRKGYARSLAAFQIDYMLEKHGLAMCHIIGDNLASEKMMASFGFSVIEEPLVWRVVYWPE